MRWVKASERLPDFENKDKTYVCRYVLGDHPMECWDWDVMNNREANSRLFDSFKFEWLDESASTPPAPDAVVNALRELVYLKSIKGIEAFEEEYERRKPLAWANAKIAIGQCNAQCQTNTPPVSEEGGDYRLLAEEIYNRLNKFGAGLGNSSILIIQSALAGANSVRQQGQSQGGEDQDEFWGELQTHLAEIYGESGTTHAEVEAKKQVDSWKSKHHITRKQ